MTGRIGKLYKRSTYRLLNRVHGIMAATDEVATCAGGRLLSSASSNNKRPQQPNARLWYPGCDAEEGRLLDLISYQRLCVEDVDLR